MLFATASSVIKVHEFPGNALLHIYPTMEMSQGPYRSISWAANGTWLTVVPYSGNAQVLSTKSYCKLLQVIDHIPDPACAAFPHFGNKNILIGTKQGSVFLYDLKTKSTRVRYPTAGRDISFVGFTAKDTHCYAGCANGEIVLYSQATKMISTKLKMPASNSLTALNAHPLKKNYLIAGSNEGIVCVWDVNLNKITFEYKAHVAPISSAILLPKNNNLAVTAGLDRSVRVFDIASKTRIASVSVENNTLSMDFLEDSKYLAMGSQNGLVRIYDMRMLSEPFNVFEAHKSSIKHLAYRGDDTGSTCSSGDLETIGSFNGQPEIKIQNTTDQFLLGDDVDVAQEVGIKVDESKTCDSFLVAVGLDEESTSVSSRKSIPNQNILKNVSTTTTTPAGQKSRLTTLKTSTPILAEKSLEEAKMSPIVGGDNNEENTATYVEQNKHIIELQQDMKNLKVQMNEFKSDLLQTLKDMEWTILERVFKDTEAARMFILNVMGAVVTMDIKQDHFQEFVRNQVLLLPAESERDPSMIENVLLRRRIQHLENTLNSLQKQ